MSENIDKVQDIVKYLEKEHPEICIRETYIEGDDAYGVTNATIELEW